ncbi:hypothetical protein DXG01_004831 [Tephrocybe rancida]|nr:hypothetical protein DXG01_004831 [Tephrocybe rancida]
MALPPPMQVISAKMEDCPILTEGRVTPLILQSWSLACKRYQKHAEKKPEEVIKIKNLNVILATSSKMHTLSNEALKVQLEANLNPDVKLNLQNEPALATELSAWSIKVKDIAHAAKRNKKKDLLSCLSDPPSRSSPTTHSSPALNNNSRCYLPKLTDTERSLLKAHKGCAYCRKFYAGHTDPNKCDMKATNTWPDAETYTLLTKAMALAARPSPLNTAMPGAASPCLTVAAALGSYNVDNKTDLYVDPPFTIPHLFAKLDLFGPNICEFPVSVHALLDNSCPSTVISADLAQQLQL